MLTPKKGDTFHPGDTVLITWEFVGADGRPPTNTNWCEQEIFLSLDGGQTNVQRLTLALDASARSFEWTVPNTPSEHAVLDIHYGCETTNSPAEVPNKQIQAAFRIVPGDKSVGSITFNRVPSQVRAGDSVSLSWTSNLVNPGPYTVSVSYDRGGEFVELQSTNAAALDWNVPSQFVGSLTFKVSAQTRDGNTVESAIAPDCTTKVVRR